MKDFDNRWKQKVKDPRERERSKERARARRERERGGEKASVALEVHLWSQTIPEVATTKTTTAKKVGKG